MPKAIWNGSLSFGLVNIPVRLYPETRPRQPPLSLVDRRDLSPVGITRINRRTGEEVPRPDLGRAATLPDGGRVLVPDEILRDLADAQGRAVRIVAFVPIEEISPAYFEIPYYLEPAPEGEKGYSILLEALRRTGKAALARTVIRHHERIAVLWPDRSLLQLSLLRWPADLRRPARLAQDRPPPPDVSPEEIAAAERLVDALSEPWRPEGLRDEYRERVKAYAAEQGAPPAPPPAPEATPEGQLLNFLERSVREAQQRPTRTA